MRPRPSIALLLGLAVSAALPVTAAARGAVTVDGGGTEITGSGYLRYVARGDASVYSGMVGPGTIILKPGEGAPPLRLFCVRRPSRPRARCAVPVRGWGGRRFRVVRPVRFLYEGSGFRLQVFAPTGFDVGIAGAGVVDVQGVGSYTTGGGVQSYSGSGRLRLP